LGYGFLLLGFTQMTGDLWMLYALSAAYAVFGVASTALAFTRAVNAFFVKYRGLALGISLTSAGFMAYLMPRFMTPFVAENGWRAGYVVMFFIVMAVLPIVYLLIRDAPDNDGLDDATIAKMQTGLNLGAALRTVLFWKIAGIFFLVAVAVLGLVPAFIPLLQDAGMTATEAGSLAAILGVSVMVGRLLVGFLIDRIFAPYLTTLVFALVGLGCLALALGGVDYAVAAAIALGFAVGAEVDLIGYYTARYFGLAHYGAIYGLQYSIFILGAGVSPILIGHIWDVTGNYDFGLMLAAALMLPVMVISLTLPQFTHE